MGFGTLFFGYFLLLNITYYGFTDIIASLIMLYAFYKLSGVNRGFKRATIATAVFSLYSIYELICAVIDMFFANFDMTSLNSANAMVRSFIICIFTVLMLIGIRDVAREVEMHNLCVRANRAAIVTFIVYGLNIVWQTTDLLGFMDIRIVVIVGYFILLATLLTVTINLISIYSCYSNICMPDDNKPREEKKSRFGFVNAFREHEEQKRREYFEYKLEKSKAKAEKKKTKQNGRNNK